MRTVRTLVSAVTLASLLIGIPAPVFASSWDPTLVVNTEAFQIIDDGDGTDEIQLQFGDSAAETLSWSGSLSAFTLSDDVDIDGNVSASGGLTINNDQSGDAALTFGNNLVNQTVTLAESDNTFQFSTGATFGGALSGQTLTLSGLENCDTIDTDANGTLICGTDETGSGSTAGSGAYISITTDEDSTPASGQYDMFEDANYPGGTLDFTTNVSENITFTPSNGRFTVNTAGTYLIVVSLIVENAGTELTDYEMDINGVTVYADDFFVHGVVDPVERTITSIQELQENDFVEFFISDTGAASNVTVSAGTTVNFGVMGRSGTVNGILEPAADNKYVESAGDTMTGQLLIDIDTNTGGLVIDSEATSEAGLAIDTLGGASTPQLLFGSGGVFDVTLFRDTADVLRTSDSFIVDGGATFNEDGTSDDFRIESLNEEYMFFVDGSTDQIGIGTSIPQAMLDIAGSFSGTTLTVSDLKNCDAISTNADGQLQCQTSGTGVLAQYTDTNGGQNMNSAGPIAVDWNSEIREDSGFTHDIVTNNSQIQLDEAGWYKITYSISTENSANNRNTIQCAVRFNGTDFVDYSTSYSYSRDNTDDNQTNVASFVYQTTAANEYYEVLCQLAGTGGIGNTIADESWTLVEKTGGLGGAGSNTTLDGAYNNDGGERTITVDTGDVSWDLTGIYDFVIDRQGTGNVGIGTDTPTTPLEVAGTITANGLTASDLANCNKITTNINGDFVCDITAGTGTFISVEVDEASNTFTVNTEVFVDTTYPGTLDFIEHARHDIDFDQTTGEFTITQTGTYLIQFNILYENTAFPALTTAEILVNSVAISSNDWATHGVTDPAERTHTIIRQLVPGDTVEFFVNPATGTSTIQDGTTANIYLISTIEETGMTAGNNLDQAYNTDTGERTIAVDDGTISWDLTGANNFVIDPLGTGGVGIGTDSPEATLEVIGVMSGALLNDQGSTPPVACAAAHGGRQWMDTDTGILYICDISNGRNKWLSTSDFVMFGDETGTCPNNGTPDSNNACNVDWGDRVGADGATNLGFYIPYNMTITAYGFSADNDACTNTFDVEVWSTGSSADDNNYLFEADVATGLDGEAHSSNTLNVDIDGDQYIIWGINNTCGGGIDDWNTILYYRWRHD